MERPVEGLRGKRLRVDAIVALADFKIAITYAERVVRTELEIRPRAEVRKDARVGNRSNIGHDIQAGIEHDRIDETGAVDVAALEIEEKRPPSAEWPAEICVPEPAVIRGRLFVEGSQKRAEGIHMGIVVFARNVSVVVRASRLRCNVNSAITQAVVFSREGIGIDANLANGGFRGHIAAGEAVNVNLGPARSDRRARKSTNLALQLVRVVRQRIQVIARNSHGAGIAFGRNLQVSGLAANLHLLWLQRNRQMDFERERLAGRQ